MRAPLKAREKERSRQPARPSRQGQAPGPVTVPLVDTPLEAAQRKLQTRADNSPRVRQLKEVRDLANRRFGSVESSLAASGRGSAPSPFRAEESATHGEASSVVQRVQVRRSTDGQVFETDDMSAEEIQELALQFYQLRNMGELRKIQAAHDDLPIADGDLYALANGEPHPRRRKRHADSEGESDNDDMEIAYRSLREDETPLEGGLVPPLGYDNTISARAHVTAGSRAQTKSRYISASRSKKVSGAWASENSVSWASKNKVGRVAAFDIPQEGSLDLTRPRDQKKVFPTGKGSSLNTAKSSQEVLVPDLVPSYMIRSIYEAVPMTEMDYEQAQTGGGQEQELFRSRTKAMDKPKPFALRETYNRELSSAYWLRVAGEHWDAAVARVVDLTQLTPEEVEEILEERTDNPYKLDYIENEDELAAYLAEIDDAVEGFS